MRTRILKLIAALPLILLLPGCQTWMPGGTTAKTADNTVSIHVPAGWMFMTSNLGRDGDLVATKDGVLLQNLSIEHRDLKEPLPNSKRTLTAELSPFEVAEAVIDDMRADRSMLNLEVSENTPAKVGGFDGFKIVSTHHVADPSGLVVTMDRYGAVVGKRLYLITFVAPTRHYFARDIAEVDAAVQTLVLTAK